MKRFIPILFLIFSFSVNSIASDLLEVLPLTNQILMLHFDDGYGIYHKRGQKRSDDKVFVEALNLSEADKLSNYLISGVNDANYVLPKQPTDIGRKTKGTEFTWLCQGWVNNACVNTGNDHVKEHWIYLYLPLPMQKGKTYTLQTNNVAKTNPVWTFVYDENQLRSEAIHVNLIGYNPLATEKYGYVYHWMGNKGGLSLHSFAAKPFYLVDLKTNETVFTGQLVFRKSKTNSETGQANDTPDKNFLGAEVYECNFSTFSKTGDFKLVVEGIGSSFPFRMAEDIYRDVFYTSIRGLYHNRSGIELKQPFTEFVRMAPHNPLITPGFAGKLKYTSSRFIDWKNGDNDVNDKPAIEAGIKGPLDVWGWYQDAGDWDSYYTHLDIPAMLMFAWQFTPDNYADGELNIPEGENGVPDILDEASWLVRCFYRIRQDVMKKGYGTGGIGTRICGDHFGVDSPNDIGRGSWQDNDRTYIVSGEDPHSTFKYAALAGQLAWSLKVLKKTDPEGVDWEKEAREAYEWAKTNTRNGDESTKPAMPSLLRDIRGYAAASLYQLTGETKYHEQLKLDFASLSQTGTLSGETRFGPMIYSTMNSFQTDILLKSKLISAIKNSANEKVSSSVSRACRWGGNFYYPLLIGHATTPMVFEVMMGWFITKDTEPQLAKTYVTCIQNTADYFLGNNSLNTSWITGLGIRRPERVFHLDSWYGDNPEMVPGITPYGTYRIDAGWTGAGPWDPAWAYKTIYPSAIASWPGHERWFSNYTCPINAEFTVHQNTVYNAVVYGFLCDKSTNSFSANKRPVITKSTIKKINPESDADKLLIQTEVSDSDTDSRIYKVEFFDGWHKIGEDFEAPFQLEWSCSGTYSFDVWVKVYDELGANSKSASLKRANIITSMSSPKLNKLELNVFPNPTNGKITFFANSISNKPANLLIFNSEGKNIKKLIINEFPFIWNLAQDKHSAGIYFYKLMDYSENESNLINGKFLYLKME